MPEMLSNYALADEAALKLALGLNAASTTPDELCRHTLNAASRVVESFLRRRLINRGTLTEYHTLNARSELFLLDFPIIGVTEVCEDPTREYGSTTVLAASSYIVVKGPGKLIRVNGPDPYCWRSGFRAVRVKYTAGYADRDALPNDIVDVCLTLAVILYQEQKRNDQGVQVRIDPTGNVTRYGVARLTNEMKDKLRVYARRDFSRTGERDDAPVLQ